MVVKYPTTPPVSSTLPSDKIVHKKLATFQSWMEQTVMQNSACWNFAEKTIHTFYVSIILFTVEKTQWPLRRIHRISECMHLHQPRRKTVTRRLHTL